MALMICHINFCILTRGYQCDRILKLQKRIVQIISLIKYNAHTVKIFKTLKLLKLNDILKLQELKLYYEYENKELPHYLQNLHSKDNTSTHFHATRIQHKIHIFRPKHEYANACKRYDTPNSVNNTPHNIIEKIYTHSLQGFPRYVKNHLLQLYQDNCTIINCYICLRN